MCDGFLQAVPIAGGVFADRLCDRLDVDCFFCEIFPRSAALCDWPVYNMHSHPVSYLKNLYDIAIFANVFLGTATKTICSVHANIPTQS